MHDVKTPGRELLKSVNVEEGLQKMDDVKTPGREQLKSANVEEGCVFCRECVI